MTKPNIRPSTGFVTGKEGNHTTPSGLIDCSALFRALQLNQTQPPLGLGLRHRNVTHRTVKEQLQEAVTLIRAQPILTPDLEVKLMHIEAALDRIERKEKWGI